MSHGFVTIGVDPGKKGGFAVMIDGAVHVAKIWDDVEFVSAMRDVSEMGLTIRAAVEKVGAHHGEGVNSVFSFGKSAGFIEGVMSAFEIPYQLISPQRWKAEFGLTSDKAQSIAVCQKLFPYVNLLPTPRCKKQSDGIAEALLMAEYARRKL